MTRKDRFDMEYEEGEEMNLSFAGCGFLGIYHVGVASCINQYAPHLVAGKIAGASAGAMTACALITGCCLGEATSWTLKLASKARSKTLGPFNPSFNIVKLIRDCFEESLPQNAHEIANGRLHISLTEARTLKNEIVSHFETREDLIQALICTSFVPVWSGVVPPIYKGKRYIDGGISDNIPILNKNTITVSPFAGESDICPHDNSENFMHINLANTSIQFTMGNMYRFTHALLPPEPEVLSSMCQQGFSDALKFLQTHNVVTVSKHLSIHSSIQAAVPVEGDEHWEAVSKPSHGQRHMSLVKHKQHCGQEKCQQCEELRHSPLVDSLSPAVVSALQTACESVNQSLLYPLYNLKVFQVLSLMAAPYTIPVDLFTSLIKRFYYWAPHMSEDFKWFISELCELVIQIAHYLQHRRKQYSARFTCELAITEMEFNQAAAEHLSKNLELDTQVGPHARHNVNLGFSVDFDSQYSSPLRRVGELRHHLVEEERSSMEVHRLKASTPSSVALDLQADPQGVIAAELADSTTADTFEQCLNIANQMDSILAYHYVDEHDPGVTRVTEIFGLDQQVYRHDPTDASWDDFIEFRAESTTLSSHEDEVNITVSASNTEFLAKRLPKNRSVQQLAPVMETAEY